MRFRSHALSRLKTLALAKLQRRLRPDRAYTFPGRLYLDVVNSCNSNCQLCPTGIGYAHPLGVMPFDAFRSFVDRVAPQVWFIGLHSWGEPTLHPDIVRMVEYCSSKAIMTSLSSNIHVYNQEVYEGLFEAGLSHLSMSLHGLSQESYEAYRPGMRFEPNRHNVQQISELRERLGAYGTSLDMVFAITAFNEHEVPLLEEFCNKYGLDSFVAYRASYNVRFLVKDVDMNDLHLQRHELEKRVRAHLDKWMAKDSRFVMPRYYQIYKDPQSMLSNKLTDDCRDPWTVMYVNYRGDVSPCCGSYDYEADSLGNVFADDVLEIWNGRKYVDSRRRLTGKSHGTDNLCASCPGALY
jgi:MoaA/NifB/PqqE/SkfB family radical SAM enzyme